MVGVEYCTGGSLEQYVIGRNSETMDESLINTFASKILYAMLEYSEKGKVHGEIKPENILVDSKGDIKLSDLGLVGETNSQSKLSPKRVAGTKRYLSPELEDGEPRSKKSDIWALGVVLLELAYGRDTYQDSNIQRMNSTKIREEFEEKGGYSSEMVEFVAMCLERKSSGRATIRRLFYEKWLRDVDFKKGTQVLKSGKNNYKYAKKTCILL